MKQQLFIFSDTEIKRKNNTLFFDIVKREIHLDFEIEREEFLFHKEVFTPTGDKKYMPVENIDSIYVFGATHFNSRLIYFLSQNSIPLYIFSESGKFKGAFYPTSQTNSSRMLLAQAEARMNEYEQINIASEFLNASVKNMLYVLKNYQKRGADLKDEIEHIKAENCAITELEEVDEALGVEGNIRRVYYSAWKKIFGYDTGFRTRLNKPAPDFVNAMISFGNALLYSTVANIIYQTKLYPELGFIHTASENKFSLAYDFADIYKPIIVDKLIFRLINKRIIKKEDFVKNSGKCLFGDEARKLFVNEFRKQLEIKAPSNTLKGNLRNAIRKDVFQLVKLLKGETDKLNFFKATR